jgi:hypothetical protein
MEWSVDSKDVERNFHDQFAVQFGIEQMIDYDALT